MRRALIPVVVLMALVLPARCQEAEGFQKPKGTSTKAAVRQLRPLMYKGKPFFPIGAYGIPNGVDLKTLKKQGWNTVLDQGAGTLGSDAIAKWLADLDKAGMVGIIGLGNFVREGKDVEVYELVGTLCSKPGLLGYYIFDEPENQYYNSDERGDKKGDTFDLHYFIRRKIGWAHQTVHAADPYPAHYTFGCIAWWTEYRNLQALCDVNLPNEYPTAGSKSEFEGEWPNIVYDAQCAAEAAQAAGGLGFVYLPMAVDIREGIEYWRQPTEREFQYSAYAPLTRGAMGILVWAGYRCSKPYAEKVVFPVTRQLSALTPFFLGEWLDGKLTCEPSDSRTDLLKQYKLPAVSGCLRRAADGRYLLLAVNNTPTSVKAAFRLDLKNLSPNAREFTEGRLVGIRNGAIADTMPAYGVRAYILTPLKAQ